MKSLTPRSTCPLFTVLLLALFILGSARPSSATEPSPSDRSDPAFFFRVFGESVKRERLDVILKVLPVEYTTEPQSLIREAAAKVDPELFALVTDLYKEASRVVSSKADLIWDCETMKQQRMAVQQMGPKVDREMFKAILALNLSLAHSQLMDLEGVKGFEFPVFLANDGAKILQSFKAVVKATPAPGRNDLRIFPTFSNYRHAFDELSESVEVYFGKDMFSIFQMEKEGDRWVPSNLRDSLKAVKESRRILKALRPEVMADAKAVAGPLVAQLREALATLEAANSTKEVDEALQGFMGIVGMMGMAAVEPQPPPPAFFPDSVHVNCEDPAEETTVIDEIFATPAG